MGGGLSVEMWLAERPDAGRQSELLQAVWTELAWHEGLDRSGMRVRVSDRAVTLSGTVGSYAEKVEAERAVKRVPGVRWVTNDLVVAIPPGSERTDHELAKAVQYALQWDVAVPGAKITATVADGQVVLEGEVDSEWERTAAERAVSRLRGVRGVTSRIPVTPPARPRDFEQRLREALSRDPELHGDRIRVVAHGGVVVLRGHVRSLAERDEAERDVRAVPGVEIVQDEVAIG